jgi:hypothetical protein
MKIHKIFLDLKARHRLHSESGLEIISAKPDENVADADAHDEAARRKAKKERHSTAMRAALGRSKGEGASLGNTSNLRDAQLKGAVSVANLARFRARELENLFAEAERLGARTAQDIAAKLNDAGQKTAQGKAWTTGNVYQRRLKIKARKATVGAKPGPTMPPKPSIYDHHGRLSTDGLRRFKAAMAAKRFRAGTTGKLMMDMGFNRHDVSICESLEQRAPMKVAFREPLRNGSRKLRRAAAVRKAKAPEGFSTCRGPIDN